MFDPACEAANPVSCELSREIGVGQPHAERLGDKGVNAPTPLFCVDGVKITDR
jgi:hypothetical protein